MTSLGCACHPKAFAFVSAPIDAPTFSPIPILPLARSLAGNTLGGNPNPLGIGIPDGASQRGVFVIAAALNETKITALECAAAPLRFANTCFLLACPPSQKANTFRKRTHSSSESEHVPFLVPFRSISFLGPSRTELCSQIQTHTRASFPPIPIHARRCPQLCAAWTAATSSCRAGGSRVLPRPPHPPCDLPVAVYALTTSPKRPKRSSETLPPTSPSMVVPPPLSSDSGSSPWHRSCISSRAIVTMPRRRI